MKALALSLSLGLCLGSAAAQTAATYIGQLARPGTGDDSPARLGLRRLTNTGFRPGAESERAAQESALLAGLANRAEWEVKSFLIDELALQGKIPAALPVAAYLANANLCEPAAMALGYMAVTEGSDPVLTALRPALAASAGKCRVSLVNALGNLRDPAAATVDALLGDAASQDANLRAVALRALAQIGDIKARAVLAEALKATDVYLRNRAVSLNLLFALRLAERGRKTDGIDIANAVKAEGAAGGRAHVVSNADTTLARIGRTVAVSARDGAEGTPAPFDLRGPRATGGDRLLSVTAYGPFTLTVTDLQGKVLRRMQGRGPGVFPLTSRGMAAGMYRAVWQAGQAGEDRTRRNSMYSVSFLGGP